VAYAALAIAIVALGISALSYRLAHRSDARQEHAARADRRGKPIIVPRQISRGATADVFAHEYTVANGGQATITRLELWMADASGKAVTTRSGEALVVRPGGSVEHHVGVPLREPPPSGELTLMVEWEDADGTHIESTGIHPGLPRALP
jgi:hypothetical protein